MRLVLLTFQNLIEVVQMPVANAFIDLNSDTLVIGVEPLLLGLHSFGLVRRKVW